MAAVLLDYAEYFGYRYKKSVIIKKTPFQHEIAAIAGLSRETVSRSFAQLEEENYIKKSGRHLVITDYPRFYNVFSS
ncbi:MAG: helix-turn-helix domain-containing protein [Candidatus Marinimicrobia bacterium]|nr:helix-turn-helix domain-containing protein [Candidatus Neomarinimicrobiota bacterium]